MPARETAVSGEAFRDGPLAHIMRKVAVIVVAAVVTGVVAGVVIAGPDGDSTREVPVPELRAPGDSTGTGSEDRAREDRGTDADGGSPDQTPQGDQQGSGEGSTGGAQPPPDSEQNDVPPPTGSPAEEAERFCEQNPGAC
jgi:hypothetical protein